MLYYLLVQPNEQKYNITIHILGRIKPLYTVRLGHINTGTSVMFWNLELFFSKYLHIAIWFLAHLSWKLKWAFWWPVMSCLSVCQSVHSSSCKLSHFHLLLQNHWANFSQTLHKAFLGEGNWSLNKWRDMPFFKGRIQEDEGSSSLNVQMNGQTLFQGEVIMK